MFRLVAQAAQQLLQSNQAKAQQQQAQQQAQDPRLQLEMKKVGIQERDVARKEKDDANDFAIAQMGKQLEEMRLKIDAGKATKQIRSQERQSTQRVAADLLKTAHIEANKPKEKANGRA